MENKKQQRLSLVITDFDGSKVEFGFTNDGTMWVESKGVPYIDPNGALAICKFLKEHFKLEEI